MTATAWRARESSGFVNSNLGKRTGAMNSRLNLYRTVVLALSGTSCMRTAPEPRIGYVVSSEGSQYSPAATFQVVSTRDGSGLTVDVDSAVVTVPGNFATPAPLALRNVYLTAYIATRNDHPMALALPDTGRFPDRRGWRAVSGSDSVLIAEDLRHGERRSLSPLHLTLPMAVTASPVWLVFRISGKVVDHRMAFDERGGLRVGPPGGSTRVYVCSERDLLGQVDSVRSNGLRQAYNLLC